MKIQSAPQGTPRVLNAPEQPKPPAENPAPAPQDKAEISVPQKRSRYDAREFLPRVISGAIRGALTVHGAQGSAAWGIAYGAGTGLVGGAVTGAISTSRVAKKDGFPILGGIMGGVLGGGYGALRGAIAGPVTVIITNSLGAGANPFIGAAVGATLAAI